MPGSVRAAGVVQARVDDGPAALPELTIAAHAAGIRIAATQVFRPTLDDVFLSLTGRRLREDEDALHQPDHDAQPIHDTQPIHDAQPVHDGQHDSDGQPSHDDRESRSSV